MKKMPNKRLNKIIEDNMYIYMKGWVTCP